VETAVMRRPFAAALVAGSANGHSSGKNPLTIDGKILIRLISAFK
jgi:hypothetical protein